MARWSPLFCCFLFYNARTGTKILLHLETVQYIIAGVVLFVLDFVASELKSFFATHRNIYYEAYQQYRIRTFKIYIACCVIMLITVITGIIALHKKKPALLIPYLIYSIFKTVGSILLAQNCYSGRHDIKAKLNKIIGGLETTSNELGFLPPDNAEANQVTANLTRYGVYAISGLLIAVAISNIHFIQVILECIYDIFRKNRKKQRASKKSKSERVDV